ncbi:MAG: ABC transporter permease [Treponema sp.]|nr:ABC transporter permease [Treponema sp.]
MNLYSFIVRRLLFMILVLVGVSLLVFTVMMILPPGQRLAAYVTSEKVTPEQMDALIAKYGLNDPAPVQYIRWLGNVLRGEFGYSVTASAPVITAFGLYFPTTLELVLYATPLIILVGVALGTLGAVRKDSVADHATRVFAIVGYSLPTFWLGLLLLMIFYGFLGIFPPGTLSNSASDVVMSSHFHHYTRLITIDAILNWRWDVFLDALYHMFLPALNLVIINSAMIMRLMRSSMLESLGQDYMMTARAKGADEKTLYKRHARRNALLPVITVSGLTLAGLMGGMVITETIFDRTGIGWWMARAATQLDVAAIMFNVLFLGTIYVMINLIVDVIYAYVDPRVRLS